MYQTTHYHLLVEMEYELHVLLKEEDLQEFKSTATTKILHNENVLHYCIAILVTVQLHKQSSTAAAKITALAK